MVARLLEACGVLPSGIMTSHITSAPLVRAASGNTRTGLSTQSEFRPSRLQGRAAVEAPQRKLLQGRKGVVLLDLCLATQVWHRLVTVEPNVLELVLCHFRFSLADDPEGRDAHASGQRRAAANCRRLLSIKYAKDSARRSVRRFEVKNASALLALRSVRVRTNKNWRGNERNGECLKYSQIRNLFEADCIKGEQTREPCIICG